MIKYELERKEIRFENFLTVDFPDKTKIKFNRNAGDIEYPAWDFLRDDDTRWIDMNAHKDHSRSNNLDKAEYLLTFAQYYIYGAAYYIFGGMYKVEKIPSVTDGIGYKLTPMEEYQEYVKRLIIKLNKPIGRDVYCRWYKNLQNQLDPIIHEILPADKFEKFPGYNDIRLTHKNLQQIIHNEATEWKNALSVVKGVYCITDTSNGELYIGSASGDGEGIWQRWSAYADVNNLTGGNKTFEKIKNNGADHIIDNFTYSILEIFDMKTKRDYIIRREEFWKKVFDSVHHGMNN